ncbi:hypothetical protein B0I37DRAFT_9467 [Chaetomium sp. MPI-CAGE-AT-0009]|nr:hypothetical protein B0I37DRAFT_9467 [Chaetomium sp. MPI-CAGE-AT-0009]
MYMCMYSTCPQRTPWLPWEPATNSTHHFPLPRRHYPADKPVIHPAAPRSLPPRQVSRSQATKRPSRAPPTLISTVTSRPEDQEQRDKSQDQPAQGTTHLTASAAPTRAVTNQQHPSPLPLTPAATQLSAPMQQPHTFTHTTPPTFAPTLIPPSPVPLPLTTHSLTRSRPWLEPGRPRARHARGEMRHGRRRSHAAETQGPQTPRRLKRRETGYGDDRARRREGRAGWGELYYYGRRGR